MSNAIAVIGAQFGDEGKGLATDYFVRQNTRNGDDPPIVARCNGGAQAGHTVVDGDRRFVFGALGAGSFADAPTYLSSRFILNPWLLAKEREQLRPLLREDEFLPTIFCHRDARVTTKYDMALNAIAELARSGRHGSCGAGINETVTRHEAGYRITFDGVRRSSTFELEYQLERIVEEWIPARLAALNPRQVKDETAKEEIEQLLRTISYMSPTEMARDMRAFTRDIFDDNFSFGVHKGGKCVVIEGAQGLMLDEFLGHFPHVTRSVTGLPSSIVAASELGHTQIQPVYVTRIYTTRHGNGPLANEGARITSSPIPVDMTNVTNKWQGSFRYAPLDAEKLINFITKDLARSEGISQALGINVLMPKLFLTCLDHLDGDVVIVEGNVQTTLPVNEAVLYLKSLLSTHGIELAYTSHGPSASDVKELS